MNDVNKTTDVPASVKNYTEARVSLADVVGEETRAIAARLAGKAPKAPSESAFEKAIAASREKEHDRAFTEGRVPDVGKATREAVAAVNARYKTRADKHDVLLAGHQTLTALILGSIEIKRR